MNFNIYVPKEIGFKLSQAAKALHCSRNAIVTEAINQWLQKHTSPNWPATFFDFAPLQDVPNFKALRSDLADVSNEDPLS